MGRVSRYKKVKTCYTTVDRHFSEDTIGVWGLGDSGRKPKKRSKTSIKLRSLRKKKNDNSDIFDIAPDSDDDFDINDPVGSLKKKRKKEGKVTEEPKISITSTAAVVATTSSSSSTKSSLSSNHKEQPPDSSSNVKTVPNTKLDKIEEDRIMKKIQKQVEDEHTKPVITDMSRRPGESKRQYNQRMRQETRQIIIKNKKETRINPEKKQKKKEFLNNKKKNKKKRKAGNDYYNNDVDENDIDLDELPDDDTKLLTGEQAVALRAKQTQVQFGEQAERPPTFQHIPRGASIKKNSNKKQKNITTYEQEEQKAMDLMRRKIQAQYNAIKLKRRQAGEFHL